MRIIKNPNPVEEREKECSRCGCIFAFIDGDVKTQTYSNGIIGPGYYTYKEKTIQCPNCGNKIIIEENSSDQAQLIEEDLTMFPHLIESDENERGN